MTVDVAVTRCVHGRGLLLGACAAERACTMWWSMTAGLLSCSFAGASPVDQATSQPHLLVCLPTTPGRFETAGRNVTLLDAPGHRDFVPNMITGAAQVGACFWAARLVDAVRGCFRGRVFERARMQRIEQACPHVLLSLHTFHLSSRCPGGCCTADCGRLPRRL